jgi:hypothetical protein
MGLTTSYYIDAARKNSHHPLLARAEHAATIFYATEFVLFCFDIPMNPDYGMHAAA